MTTAQKTKEQYKTNKEMAYLSFIQDETSIKGISFKTFCKVMDSKKEEIENTKPYLRD